MRIRDGALERLLKKNPTEHNKKVLASLSSSGSRVAPTAKKRPLTNNTTKLGGSNDAINTEIKARKVSSKKSAEVGIPEWLKKIIYEDVRLVLATKTKRAKLGSPHARSLVALAKRPSLYVGAKKEHFLQVALFYMVEVHYPEMYKLMSSTPNGGHRFGSVGGQMKAEGQKKGYPDISIDCARGSSFGFRLEVKTDVGTLSEFQSEWLDILSAEGYSCHVGWGFKECWEILVTYCKLPKLSLANTKPLQR